MQGDESTSGSNSAIVVAPMPPADAAEPDRAERRRAEVDAMVRRCLDPAMGLCSRALDPDGLDSVGREESRRLVMQALADRAKKQVSADDASVRSVMRRVCELGLDALLGNPGSARIPAGVDLGDLLSDEIRAEAVAPEGRLPFPVLQDAVAASRATDRQVAFMVLAASIAPADACILLGVDADDLDSSLHRIGRRVSEGHSGSDSGARES